MSKHETAIIKFNGGRMALLCNICRVVIRTGFDPSTVEDKFYGCEQHKYLDPIQNNCVYGWILPDRCQYTAHLGCECGAHPPLKWDGDKYVRTREMVHK